MRPPIARVDAPPQGSGWRVWLPDAERDSGEGNPCFGIALAVLLSLPIWIAVAVLTLAVRF